MATEAFYRKWRSQTFEELLGQEHVTQTLRNAVRTGRVAHAYAFCGPRGVGKTSAARLLAKSLNCDANRDGSGERDGEPCNECRSCRSISEGRALDITEIDAASNRGIDEIRDLREKVNFAPSESLYKFYILDEAHMLTPDAFNALLKTLEEPPPHTIFILVTTEAHRLPATVISRCQRLDFRRIRMPAMIQRLEWICEAEGVQVDSGVLELIARSATGSLRDAEGLLDQLVAYAGRQITLEEVRSVVGLAGGEAAHMLIESIINNDLSSGLRLINQLVAEGTDPRQFARETVSHLRGLMLLHTGDTLADLVEASTGAISSMQRQAERLSLGQIVAAVRAFAQSEMGLRGINQTQLPLEMAFVEAVLATQAREDALASRSDLNETSAPRSYATAPQGATSHTSALPAKPMASAPVELGASSDSAQSPDKSSVVSDSPSPSDSSSMDSGIGHSPSCSEHVAAESVSEDDWQIVVDKWGEVVDRFRGTRLGALLVDAAPLHLEGGAIVLACRYRFHRDALDETKNRTEVETMLSQVLGRQCRVRCVEAKLSSQATATPSRSVDSALGDPVVKEAIAMGWRVKRITKRGESVHADESEDDSTDPGEASADSGAVG